MWLVFVSTVGETLNQSMLCFSLRKVPARKGVFVLNRASKARKKEIRKGVVNCRTGHKGMAHTEDVPMGKALFWAWGVGMVGNGPFT